MNNKRISVNVLIFIIALYPATNYAAIPSGQAGSVLWQSVKTDYNQFYSGEQWTGLGIVFGVGAIMANTNTDQELQNRYQDYVRDTSSDDLASMVKGLGDWKYLVPVSLVAAGIGYTFPQDTGASIGVWGERTFRAYLVAAPTMAVGQYLTGASRPEERSDASHWRPFRDNNGVSGHAFVGAVPFITIAKMTNNPFIRYASYAASVLTAWSRVNDNAHFTSQVLLGWCIGYAAADTIASTSTNVKTKKLQFSLSPWGEGAIARIAYQW